VTDPLRTPSIAAERSGRSPAAEVTFVTGGAAPPTSRNRAQAPGGRPPRACGQDRLPLWKQGADW